MKFVPLIFLQSQLSGISSRLIYCQGSGSVTTESPLPVFTAQDLSSSKGYSGYSSLLAFVHVSFGVAHPQSSSMPKLSDPLTILNIPPSPL